MKKIGWMALAALVLGLAASRPAGAVKLWDDWKVDRPQGPGGVFYAAALTGERPDMGQDVFFGHVPGTNHTSATLPEDIGLEIVFIAGGHSGRMAKDKDRKELVLKMLGPHDISWRAIDAQRKREQERLPRAERWSGVLRARFRPNELEYGVTTFKVDFPYDNDPPFILINRVHKTLDRLMAEAAGAQAGVLPEEAAVMPPRLELLSTPQAMTPAPITPKPSESYFNPDDFARRYEAPVPTVPSVESGREVAQPKTVSYTVVVARADMLAANGQAGLRPDAAWLVDGRVGDRLRFTETENGLTATTDLPESSRVGLAFPRVTAKWWAFWRSADGRTLHIVFAPPDQGGRP